MNDKPANLLTAGAITTLKDRIGARLQRSVEEQDRLLLAGDPRHGVRHADLSIKRNFHGQVWLVSRVRQASFPLVGWDRMLVSAASQAQMIERADAMMDVARDKIIEALVAATPHKKDLLSDILTAYYRRGRWC